MDPKEEQDSIQDVTEKKRWVTPEVQEYDLKEATKASTPNETTFDGIFFYS